VLADATLVLKEFRVLTTMLVKPNLHTSFRIMVRVSRSTAISDLIVTRAVSAASK